jgi:AraC-like DNA-binding protein
MVEIMILKNKTIKYKWIASYVILFFLPLIISLVMFLKVDGTIEKEEKRSNLLVLKQIRQYMDTLVSDVDKLAMDLSSYYKVQQIRSFNGELKLDERLKIFELNKELNNRIFNDSILNVYIFFKRINTVVNNNNVMEATDYFNMLSDKYEIDKDKFIELNNKEHNGSYVNIDSKNSYLKNEGLFIYFLTVPVNTNIDGSAKIAIIIDKSKFLNIAQDIQYIGKGEIAVLANNNELVLQSGRYDVLSKFKYDRLSEGFITNYNKINKDKIVVSYVDSQIKKWKYLYIVPKDEYWNKLESYRELIYIGVIFCVFMGIGIALILFKRNYEPLKELVKSINNSNSSFADQGNEYNLIESVIEDSLHEKDEIDKWITFQREVLRNRYIESLLKGAELEFQDMNCDMLEVSFIGEYFQLLSFYIEDTVSFFENDTNGYMESYKLFQFIVHNLSEELIGDRGKVYTLDIDNNIICLINFSDISKDIIPLNNIDNLKNYTRELAYKIHDIVKLHYKVNCRIGISNIYDIKFMKKTYDEAKELLEFSESVGGDDILDYNDISRVVDRIYCYPVEFEKILISALKSGNYDKTSLIIDEIFNRNFKENIVSYNLILCLRFNIVGTVINAINELGNYYGEKYLKYIMMVEELAQLKNINKLKEKLMLIIKHICESVDNEEKVKDQFGEKIKVFIKDSYKDENLNITNLAHRFNIHPSYLSKLFKNETGEGILDYINRIRIEEAKMLLLDKQSNMETIASSVGYSSVKTFSRYFVKFEGIAPSKYRDENC